MKKYLGIIFVWMLLFTVLLPRSVKAAEIEHEHEHLWSAVTVTQAPTCVDEGQGVSICSLCGELKYTKIRALGHQFSTWEIVENATPFEEGSKVRTCYLCDTEETTVIEKRLLTENEKKAVSTTTNFLKKIKKYDFDGAEKYQKGRLGYYSWDKKKSPFYSITKYQFKKRFSYNYLDVKSNGNSVIVKVEVAYPNAYSQTYKSMNEALNYSLNHPELTDDYIVEKYLYPRIIQRIRKYGTTKETATISFVVKKTSNGWKITKMNGGKKMGLMHINEAMNDWNKKWDEKYY